jgi:hypothetical protein
MDLNNPKDVEEILDILFSLPDESDSKTEGDEGAVDELNASDDTLGRASNDVSVRQGVLGGELDTDSIVLPSNGSNYITSDSESEEEWGFDCSYFNNVKSNFEARRQGKPKHDFSASDRELEYFSKFFDNDILTLIANETNLHAKQNSGSISPSNNWVDTTIQEMKAFIGCLIVMGIHHLPAL